MKLLVLICIIHQVFGFSLKGLFSSLKKFDPTSTRSGARATSEQPRPYQYGTPRPYDAKSLKAAFDQFPNGVGDPKYIEDLLKEAKRIPGGHKIALDNFNLFLKNGMHSSDSVKTFRAFMDNIDSMVDPKLYSVARINKKYDILGKARNTKGIDRKMTGEIERYRKIFNYEHKPDYMWEYDGDGFTSVVLMETKVMNQRIYDLAIKRNDRKMIAFLQSKSRPKFFP